MKHFAYSLLYSECMFTPRGYHLISCETAHYQTLLALGLKPRPLVACLAFGKATGSWHFPISGFRLPWQLLRRTSNHPLV